MPAWVLIIFWIAIIGLVTYIVCAFLLSQAEVTLRNTSSQIDGDLMDKHHTLKKLLKVTEEVFTDEYLEKNEGDAMKAAINVRFGMTPNEQTYIFNCLKKCGEFIEKQSSDLPEAANELMKEYKAFDMSIAKSGNEYNNAVQKYNTLISKFPVSLYAAFKKRNPKNYFN